MEPTNSVFKNVFLLLSKNKKSVLGIIHTIYILIASTLIITFYLNFEGLYLREMGQLAVLSGQTSVILFILAITPGILRRFNITWQIRNILMLFRRQIGVLTFSFAFLHVSLMRLYPILLNQLDWSSLFTYTFEIMGLISIVLLSFLFFTSNDWSVRKLGPWWKRIHMLIYIIAWTIMLHVSLINNTSILSRLILVFAILETISLIKFYIFPKKIIPPPTNPLPTSPPSSPQSSSPSAVPPVTPPVS